MESYERISQSNGDGGGSSAAAAILITEQEYYRSSSSSSASSLSSSPRCGSQASMMSTFKTDGMQWLDEREGELKRLIYGIYR
eukprot:scaffold7797_cov170-Skeletonema_menzelii.AAC.1